MQVKIAVHRLSPQSYPWAIEVQTRFSDLSGKHLGFAAIAQMYGEARQRFMEEHLGGPEFWEGAGLTHFLASMNINYLLEASYPDRTWIGLGVGQIGRSSHQLSAAMFQDGRCVNIWDCTAVIVSKESRRPERPPESLRRKLAQFQIQM